MKIRNLIIAAAAVCMTVACTKDADQFNGSDKPSSKPMSVTEQKAELNDKATEAINKINVTKEGDLIEVGLLLTQVYGSYGVDSKFIEQLQKNCVTQTSDTKAAFSAAVKALGDLISDPTATPKEISTNSLVVAAGFNNITGIFTANETTKTFDYTAATDKFELNFNDAKGVTCTIAIKASKKYNVLSVSDEDIDRYLYYVGDKLDYWTKEIDNSKFTINVPAKIDINVAKGGSTVGSVAAKLGLGLTISVHEYDNYNYADGYWDGDEDTTIFEKIDYKKLSADVVIAGKSHAVAAQVVADGDKLEEYMELVADGETLLSEYLTFGYDMDHFADFAASEDAEEGLLMSGFVGDAKAVIALGDIYLAGSYNISEYESFMEMMEKASSEADIQALVAKVNGMMSARLYFGENKWQAQFVVEYDSENGGLVPMIEFADGTKYAFSEAFEAEDFNKVMAAVQALMADAQKAVADAASKLPVDPEEDGE